MTKVFPFASGSARSDEEVEAMKILQDAQALQEKYQAEGKPLDITRAIMLIQEQRRQLQEGLHPVTAEVVGPNANELLIAARTLQKEREAIDMPLYLSNAIAIVSDRFAKAAAAQPVSTAIGSTSVAATVQVERAVTAAIDAGKVTEGNRAWASSYAAKDLAGFQGFVAKAPVLDNRVVMANHTQVLESADEIGHAATIYQTKKALEGVDVDFTSAVVAVRDLRAAGRA